VPAPLPSPVITDVFTRWTLQPVALAAAIVLAGWYGWSVRALGRGARTNGRTAEARTGNGWPARRSVGFALGIVVLLWTTCGFAEVYASSLFWVWTSQQLLLLLIVSVLLMSGQPIELARGTRGERSLPVRLVTSPAGRLFANPLVGPVLIPAISVPLFFGPLPGWAIDQPALGWVLPVLIVAAGALIVLPLVSTDDQRGSMAVALALTIGVFELLLDAVPGIALRLQTNLVTNYFDFRTAHTWAPTALHDQQLGGAVLWCVAELIDVPFLLLIFLRWLRADERDAAEIDTVLEAERIARAEPTEDGRGATDSPWWLSDPKMRDRYR
jgi:putative membrane protein